MYASLYACFHPSHQLLGSACHLFLLTCDAQDAICHVLLLCLSHTDRPDLWLLIHCNNPPSHQSTV